MDIIWENSIIYIVREPNELPWLKIFAKSKKKELTDCSAMEQEAIFKIALTIEQALREYYAPSKINHASFGNVMPQVHWHVQARFEDDAFFPEPMWGKKQRDAHLVLAPFEGFADLLKNKLKEY